MSPTRAAAHVRRLATITAWLAIATAIGSIAARAEVLVEGDAAALRVYARESQVAEVLSALGSMQVRVRTSIALDKVVSGTYSGSLRQVLARVLEGYNYVIKPLDTTAEVVVIGVRGERAIAANPPSSPPRRSLAAEWRSPIDPNAPARK
jgi:hypothetical protein